MKWIISWFYDGLNVTTLTRAILALVPLAFFIGIFALFVWVMFKIADVEPGWVYRWRALLGFIVLWLIYGFAMRVVLGFLSSGMIATDGWVLLASIIAWPPFAWWALAVI